MGVGMTHSERSARGFTLIEILVVVAILGVLMGLVALLIPKAGKEQQKFTTNQRIQQLSAAIDRYRNEPIGKNRPPPMTLAKLAGLMKQFEGLAYASPNVTNESSEVLYLALRHPDLSAKLNPGQLAGDGAIANTDEDQYNRPPPGGGSDPSAQEVVDAWGNPIIYIEKNSYDAVFQIVLRDGTTVEVKAKKRPDGTSFNDDSYQLISLGPNEAWDEPGSAGYDDITNFTGAER